MSHPARVVHIPTRGPFCLEELGTFGYGHLTLQPWDGVWRLAFGLDDRSGHAGVEVRQVAPEELELTVHAAPGSVEVAVRQTARIASCDHDGNAFHALGAADPVLRRLLAAAPGLRPPLFVSPYEAAVWALLTQRRSRRQGTVMRQWISDRHGVAFDLAGRRVSAMPLPERLLEVEVVPGLPREQVPRLHAVARAALDGRLDVDRLAALDPETARRELEAIPGIGPFSSALIVMRSCGLSDVLPLAEPRSRAAVTALYADAGVITGELTDEGYRELARAWRPFRTWVAVMARAAGGRVAAWPAGAATG